jgi:hypothetical protein
MIDGDISAVRQMNLECPKWIGLPNLSQLFHGHVGIQPHSGLQLGHVLCNSNLLPEEKAIWSNGAARTLPFFRTSFGDTLSIPDS